MKISGNSSGSARLLGSSLILLACVAGTGARAQELEFSYGVDLVTNYISKGLTQTDNDPAIQPYVEVTYGLGYFGLWASNASFGGDKDIELDVSVGIRPEFGKLSLDLGFAQYLYRDDEEDYGEAYIFGDYAANDQLGLNFKYYREVYAEKDWFYVGAEYSGLPWDLTLSGGIGTDFGTDAFSEDSVAADIGVSGDISENASFDFRASDSSIEGSRFIATLSFYN
jgi:uncharacterized protein (TIGR02001 family)